MNQQNRQNDDNRTIIMSEVMTPEKANFAGNIHGGHLLQLLDKVAYACAARYSGCYVVTLSVDKVYFKQPIHVGELVTCLGCVNHVGHSSMEIGIKVIAENLETGEKRHTNSCYFTMVALDKNHQPTTVTPLTLRDDKDKKRFEEARIRKEVAKLVAEEHAKRKQKLSQ